MYDILYMYLQYHQCFVLLFCLNQHMKIERQLYNRNQSIKIIIKCKSQNLNQEIIKFPIISFLRKNNINYEYARIRNSYLK